MAALRGRRRGRAGSDRSPSAPGRLPPGRLPDRARRVGGLVPLRGRRHHGRPGRACPGSGRRRCRATLAFVDVLGRMGAGVERAADSIAVRRPRPLQGIDGRHGATCPTRCRPWPRWPPSPTRPPAIRGIGFIRRQGDRPHRRAWWPSCGGCGVDADEEDDGLVVRPGAAAVHGARVRTYDDHRMAMSFALLGLRVPGIEIEDPGVRGQDLPDVLVGARRARSAPANRHAPVEVRPCES